MHLQIERILNRFRHFKIERITCKKGQLIFIVRDIQAYKNQIAILEEIIAQNKSAKINTDLSQINEHLLELHHENQQLKDDIDKRESTLKNLIYRYDQSERKVREFIKTTLRLVIFSKIKILRFLRFLIILKFRTIMERQQRIQDNQMDDSRLSEVFHL